MKDDNKKSRFLSLVLLGLVSLTLVLLLGIPRHSSRSLLVSKLSGEPQPNCIAPVGFSAVRDSQDLINIRENVYGNYFMCNDISLEGVVWTPDFDFWGTLEGNHKRISNLRLNLPSAFNVGLFRRIQRDGIVKNLEIHNFEIHGRSHVGALAGRNHGIIENVHVTGASIISTNALDTTYRYAGGLVGSTQPSSDISHSSVRDTVHVYAFSIVGGFVGQHEWGSIRNSYSQAEVSSVLNSAGGFVGTHATLPYTNHEIINCYSTGTVISTDNYTFGHGSFAGSISVGAGDDAVIASSYAIVQNLPFIGYQGPGDGTVIDSRLATLEELTSSPTETDLFEGWDFENVWQSVPGSLPTLR